VILIVAAVFVGLWIISAILAYREHKKRMTKTVHHPEVADTKLRLSAAYTGDRTTGNPTRFTPSTAAPNSTIIPRANAVYGIGGSSAVRVEQGQPGVF